MRRIETREKIEKKKKKKQIIIGVILIGLMIVSTAGYGFLSKDDENSQTEKEYNGFKFIKQQGKWYAEINRELFSFQHLPQETENISVSGSFNLQDFSEKPLYFVNNNQAGIEIAGNIGRYVLRYQNACLSDCEDLPKKTCADNIIIFSKGNESKIVKEQNCVYIYGDYMLGADTFLYHLLGVR